MSHSILLHVFISLICLAWSNKLKERVLEDYTHSHAKGPYVDELVLVIKAL